MSLFKNIYHKPRDVQSDHVVGLAHALECLCLWSRDDARRHHHRPGVGQQESRTLLTLTPLCVGDGPEEPDVCGQRETHRPESGKSRPPVPPITDRDTLTQLQILRNKIK